MYDKEVKKAVKYMADFWSSHGYVYPNLRQIADHLFGKPNTSQARIIMAYVQGEGYVKMNENKRGYYLTKKGFDLAGYNVSVKKAK